MGQLSVEISRPPGSVLNGNQLATVRERDTWADAVIAIAGQLKRVIELAARTLALRHAAALVGGA